MLANFPMLDSFDSALSFEKYNVFNCHRIRGLMEVEKQLARALREFPQLEASERAVVQSSVGLELAAKLTAFAIRMASAAVRESNVDYLCCGVIAISLDLDLLDPRDVYLALAVLADAGTRISAPFDSIVNELSPYGTPGRRRIMVDGFLGGAEYMRSISSMGVELGATENGIAYVVRLY